MPPLAGAITDPGQQAQAVQEAIVEKDKTITSDENVSSKDEAPEAKKKPQANLGNYFRVFRYGTKFDMLLMGSSCLASIGAGIALPLMNIVRVF